MRKSKQNRKNSSPKRKDIDLASYKQMSQGSTNKIDYRYIKKAL
jgi:hypothetical protein